MSTTAVAVIVIVAVAMIVTLAVILAVATSSMAERVDQAYAEGMRDGRTMENAAAVEVLRSVAHLATLDRVRVTAEQLARREQLNAARRAAGAPPLRHEVADFLAAQARRAARKGR